MALLAIFLENCQNNSRSSTWTMTSFYVSASFFSAALFYRGIKSEVSSLRNNAHNLLCSQHFHECGLHIIQEDFRKGIHLQFTECLYAIHYALIWIFVYWDSNKFGLSNPYYWGHDEHCLFGSFQLSMEENNEFCAHICPQNKTLSWDFPLKQRTSLVNNDPVKKLPPKINAAQKLMIKCKDCECIVCVPLKGGLDADYTYLH